jgi:hypothetical protein
MSNISPLILLIAILLDIFGFICLILTFTMGAEIGETLSFVPDILGLIFLGGREIFLKRRRAISQAGKAKAKAMMKAKGKHGLKFLFAFFVELLPFIGAFPFWTLYVLSEAKRKEAAAYASA